MNSSFFSWVLGSQLLYVAALFAGFFGLGIGVALAIVAPWSFFRRACRRNRRGRR